MSQRNDKLTHCSPSENGPVALIVSAILAVIAGGGIGLLLLALFGAWPTVNHLTAFDVGVQAFERGISRSKNPYMAGDDRVDWFRGWDRAKSMTAQKGGVG
jgi:ribosome modulation factor